MIRFTTGSIETLQSYDWPGNIRQLQNIVERAVLQANGSWITVAQTNEILAEESGLHTYSSPELPAENKLPQVEVTPTEPSENAAGYDDSKAGYRPYMRVEENQSDDILVALKKTGGNQTHAAQMLGLTVRQLRYRIAKLELETTATQKGNY